MLFSIVTVSYNSGKKLKETIDSILSQTYQGYEIVVKDGLSTDGSLQNLQTDDRLKIVSEKDRGIYDAMNAAMQYVHGEYVLFLNCGDYLYESDTLQKVAEFIENNGKKKGFYYGDYLYRSRNVLVSMAGELSNYRLMTRTICHQCIFFSKDSFDIIQYRPETFKLAADLDLYMRVLKQLGGQGIHMPFPVSNYEGEGVSDGVEGRKEILRERRLIMKECLDPKEYRRANILRVLTLQALKEKIGTVAGLRKTYETIARFIYGVRERKIDDKSNP